MCHVHAAWGSLCVALSPGQAEVSQWGTPRLSLALDREPGRALIRPDLLYERQALPLIGPGLGRYGLAWCLLRACVGSR